MAKERITVSLSRESARFLRTFRAKTHSPSMSAALEQIVANLQGRGEMEQLDEKVKAYYDSMQESTIREDYSWGDLGETALSEEVEENRQERGRPQLAHAE